LLLTTPVNVGRYTYYTWDEWILRYSPTRKDGLWLADGTDRYPDFSLHDLKSEGPGTERPSDDPALLASLAGVGEANTIGAFLTVDGSWLSPDGVRVAISSVLVPVADSEAAARALGTAPPSHMWLPTFEDLGDETKDDRQRKSDMAPLEPWITDQHAELQIDERDPFGCREATQRSRPAKHIIKAFELHADEPWANAWLDLAGRSVFLSLAWGRSKGRGERETLDSGSAVQCERAFLSELLKARKRDLIVLVKLEHYRGKSLEGASDNGSGDRFSYAHAVLSIDRDLQVRHVVPKQSDFLAVEGLGHDGRYDYQERLRAIGCGPGG
jgi:hypothetical protein